MRPEDHLDSESAASTESEFLTGQRSGSCDWGRGCLPRPDWDGPLEKYPIRQPEQKKKVLVVIQKPKGNFLPSCPYLF